MEILIKYIYYIRIIYVVPHINILFFLKTIIVRVVRLVLHIHNFTINDYKSIF